MVPLPYSIIRKEIDMSVYNINGEQVSSIYDIEGNGAAVGYDNNGYKVFPSIVPIVPSGGLTAYETITLPNIYGDGHGFTCTGLAYDERNDLFLVGDIGMQQPGGTMRSQIVKLSTDFTTVIGTIALYEFTSNDVQGIAIRKSDNTIWFCSPTDNVIYHISSSGILYDYFSVARPTGIAYDRRDDTLWVLTMNNKILHLHTDGTQILSVDFAYTETLDQCFLDENGYLYITAGVNYQGRNNIYLFDTSTSNQSITCTVDSYSVEGICILGNYMYILNDGYYHSAIVDVNQVNIYQLTE